MIFSFGQEIPLNDIIDIDRISLIKIRGNVQIDENNFDFLSKMNFKKLVIDNLTYI
jgi:hypothetical protein